MKKYILCLTICLITPALWAASFDCKNFTTGVYKMICESPELSKLDDELNQRYLILKTATGNNKEFKEFVQAALKERGQCKNQSCLLAWYNKVIHTLDIGIEKSKPSRPALLPRDNSEGKYTLQDVFIHDLIDTKTTWLEKQIGPAQWEDAERKVYKLEHDCLLTVYVDTQNNIEGMETNITPECRVDLTSFFPDKKTKIATKNLRVKNLENAAGPLVYYSDCLYLCGNAFEPVDYGFYQGRKTNGFIDIAVGSYDSDHSQWTNLMIEKEGEDWVIEQKYNCDPDKYAETARNALKDSLVQQVYVGRNLTNRLSLTRHCK